MVTAVRFNFSLAYMDVTFRHYVWMQHLDATLKCTNEKALAAFGCNIEITDEMSLDVFGK